MSIAFVDREPEKQEIERLRQLLGGYGRMPLPSLLFPFHSYLIEVMTEAFGISKDVFCDSADFPVKNSPFKIVLNPISFGDVAKTMKYSFAAYWEYLSKFNLDMQNYREYPAKVGAASVELLYKSDGQLDLSKSSFLFLGIGENRGRLSQYAYFVDPQKLHWHFHEVSSESSIFNIHTGDDFDFLYGDDNDTVYRIVINKSQILRYLDEQKEPGKNKKRKKGYFPTLWIEYFLSQHRRTWCSDAFLIEPLSASQIAQFHTAAAARAQKEATLSQLEEYIRTDPEEREFQKLLWENRWVFGHEYSEFLDKRELVIDSQQDFVGRRAIDGFWEVIEIKRPLNGTSLFREDKSHHTLYPGVELSKALGQVIPYIDRIDHRHDSILIDRAIDMNKVRVKLIIGRDGDERQVSALNNLNSHLNRIEIRTYGQLLKGARRHLPDY